MVADGGQELDKDGQDVWARFLDRFERDVWPLFKARGYSKESALQVYMINKVSNAIYSLGNEGEEWRDG